MCTSLNLTLRVFRQTVMDARFVIARSNERHFTITGSSLSKESSHG